MRASQCIRLILKYELKDLNEETPKSQGRLMRLANNQAKEGLMADRPLVKGLQRDNTKTSRSCTCCSVVVSLLLWYCIFPEIWSNRWCYSTSCVKVAQFQKFYRSLYNSWIHWKSALMGSSIHQGRSSGELWDGCSGRRDEKAALHIWNFRFYLFLTGKQEASF